MWILVSFLPFVASLLLVFFSPLCFAFLQVSFVFFLLLLLLLLYTVFVVVCVCCSCLVSSWCSCRKSSDHFAQLNLRAVRLDAHLLHAAIATHWGWAARSRVAWILYTQRGIGSRAWLLETGTQRGTRYRLQCGTIRHTGHRCAHRGNTSSSAGSIAYTAVWLAGGICHRHAIATARLLETRIIECGGTARRWSVQRHCGITPRTAWEDDIIHSGHKQCDR